ncbi:uncharacterized protein CcaverHIS019_0111380 [Cutaneotrichosporon cavernicola]|uniref:Phosphatidate phosphatase APP1 catalytic domain-containing protein n=1 Tax=Cutaneotrichosporon cavernicola TaxID=279322 RepID=A0AA48I5W2_9TREE|nr:uncharacterized protein CcaverHIS019_0111380 [Cutaneotrichosporon cavernicola]BEI88420.1 hypothetical protein CcaverHIS019_0111380 [Cutaneotrichosporon cavernicola]BEI96193.1 hypothetical protein CcaverHIS631_0111420 [Cutaneotrichosporon cavernicola]BEJ03964.1 hypothetical protein CcaverHIS641_0111390 [Cutaneotrichosporon cavernicola]
MPRPRIPPAIPPKPRHTGGKRTRALNAVSSVTHSSAFQSASGATAGLTSRARGILSTAASFAAGAATHAASSVTATSSGTEKPQTWGEWAREWRDGRKGPVKGQEVLNLLPGWAVKRPCKDGGEDAFDLHVSTTGFCSFIRDPSTATRTQRALMGIAKRFAALPTLPVESQMSQVINEALSDEPAPMDFPAADKPRSATRSGAASLETASKATDSPPPSRSNTSEVAFENPEFLSLAHKYLDSRLRPFWSSVLPFRRVALSMYTIPLTQKSDGPPPKPDAELLRQEPLMRTTFTTNGQGHFAHHFVIPWQRICTHPQSVPMAFADDPANDRTEWGLVIHAELLSEEGPDCLIQASYSEVPYEERVPRRVSSATSFFSSAEPPNQNDGDGEQEMGLMGLGIGRAAVTSDVVIGVSRPGGIRVISDLDDTVKHSDILSGPREVFRNVFCRRLEDIAVPGMSELYQTLTKEGMSSLHFVSNSPFELFPIVSEFFRLNHFPTYYSLKLKFYGGRSIITSLFEPAGQRKRPSILEILDEFDDSTFILIGDSGEQDLELYTAIAHERPTQVAAIFIRDVTSGRVDELRNLAGEPSKLDNDIKNMKLESPPSGTSTPSDPRPTKADIDGTMAELQELSASEQKLLRLAAKWEYRVQQAYELVPDNIPLVFFKEAEEIESLASGIVREAAKEAALPPSPTGKARAEHFHKQHSHTVRMDDRMCEEQVQGAGLGSGSASPVTTPSTLKRDSPSPGNRVQE